jgi:hypothetical protein
VTGTAASVSAAAGTVTGTLALTGAATASSSSAGTIFALAALAGYAESDSVAAASVTALLEIDGLAIAVSGGDGWVLPPLVVGALPPEVPGIVFVNPAPDAHIGLNRAFSAEVVAATASSVTTDGIDAEVQLWKWQRCSFLAGMTSW